MYILTDFAYLYILKLSRHWYAKHRLAFIGMYILAEALQNFISIHAASTLIIRTQVFFYREIQPSYKIRPTS